MGLVLYHVKKGTLDYISQFKDDINNNWVKNIKIHNLIKHII